MPTPQESLLLSAAAYSNGVPSQSSLPSGWSVLTDSSGQPVRQVNAADGFQAVAFFNQNTGEVVVAFAGTQISPAAIASGMTTGTIGADGSIVAGTPPAANTDAINFTESVAQITQLPIFVTGHSLGGEEAQAVGAAFQDSSTVTISGGATFGAPGAPGVPQLNLNNPNAGANFTNYYTAGDVIGNYTPNNGGYFGNSVLVGPPTGSNILQNIDIQAANAAAAGNTGGAAFLTLLGAGTTLSYHLLGTPNGYFNAFGINPQNLSYDAGIADILNAPAINVATPGTSTSETPYFLDGNVHLGGESVGVGSNSITITDNSGNDALILTQSGQNINAGGSNSSVIIDDAGSNTISSSGTIYVDLSSSGTSLTGNGDESYIEVDGQSNIIQNSGSNANVVILGDLDQFLSDQESATGDAINIGSGTFGNIVQTSFGTINLASSDSVSIEGESNTTYVSGGTYIRA